MKVRIQGCCKKSLAEREAGHIPQGFFATAHSVCTYIKVDIISCIYRSGKTHNNLHSSLPASYHLIVQKCSL